MTTYLFYHCFTTLHCTVLHLHESYTLHALNWSRLSGHWFVYILWLCGQCCRWSAGLKNIAHRDSEAITNRANTISKLETRLNKKQPPKKHTVYKCSSTPSLVHVALVYWCVWIVKEHHTLVRLPHNPGSVSQMLKEINNLIAFWHTMTWRISDDPDFLTVVHIHVISSIQ